MAVLVCLLTSCVVDRRLHRGACTLVVLWGTASGSTQDLGEQQPPVP
jgi:hypothetical protein